MNVNLTLADLAMPESTRSEICADHAVRIGATINAAQIPARGDPLPVLWHWGYFTPTAATAGLGADGHPSMPIGPLFDYPRRMWASGKVAIKAPLIIGAPAIRTSAIVAQKETAGRSGDLFIITVEHRYSQLEVDQIIETQTLVYRRAGPTTLLPLDLVEPDIRGEEWHEHHTVDTATLFRFSSVTFNSHRIHYDEHYATSVEGYPALVVHGPLTALLVAEAIRHHAGCHLAKFEFRSNAPLFVNLRFSIIGTAKNPAAARVVRNDGTEAMTATAVLETSPHGGRI